VRTLILTWQASDAGPEVLEKWHDPAGFSIFLVSFGLLWAGALWLKRRRDSLPPGTCPPPRVRSSSAVISHPAMRRYLLIIGCWSLCVIGVNELWYRAHEFKSVESARWWVNFPTHLATFSNVEVPMGTRKLLKYDQGAAGLWQNPEGAKWQAFCFRWQPGNPTARMSALGHRPEYCLSGSGHELKSDLGTKLISAGSLDLPFRAYIFNDSPRTLYVFFCLWEDAAEKQVGFGRSKYLDRLRSVVAGRRGLGQQTLEIVVSGCTDMAAAEKAVRQQLPELIQMEVHSATAVAAGP